MDHSSLTDIEVSKRPINQEILKHSNEDQSAPTQNEFPSVDELCAMVTSDDPPTDADLDRIIAAIDLASVDDIPEAAIRAAQRYYEEITPRLIELLREATQIVRDGEELERFGYLIAFLLLTEFRKTEALPVLVEAISLPGDMPETLFGDSITEDLTPALAALAADTPDVLDSLIANPKIDEYVRGAAAGVYLHLVRDGRMTRDEAVARLHKHLQHACELRDDKIAYSLVSDLCGFVPVEAIQTIQRAYELEIADEAYISLEHVQDAIEEGESFFQRELQGCRPTGFQDTFDELRKWQRLSEWTPAEIDEELEDEDWDDGQNYPGDWAKDDEDHEPIHGVETIVNAGPRVGRNEQCPCGSGKKYKKCCGGR